MYACEAPRGLLELTLAAGLVTAAGVEPGDRDVDEPLEEVALAGWGITPLVLELLVRLEVRALADQLQPSLEAHREPIIGIRVRC